MKLCYQVATPDVAIAPAVTAYQGDIDKTFSDLAAIGYDGVELMTLDPGRLDWDEVKSKAARYGLDIALVCTGEVYGQLGISFADRDEAVREKARKRVCEIIDFAAYLGADINIGRVRGQYRDDVPRGDTYRWALEGMRGISDYAAPKNVRIALETVNILQGNFLNTMAEAAKMADDVGRDNFKLMIDVFHLNIEEKDMYAAIRAYAGYNIHVHLADSNRRYPGHCGMDFEKVVRTFRELGYDGAFCTEIFQLPDQETAAKGAMAHLAPIFERIYKRPTRGASGK